jgi:hypothetical protein
MRCNIGFVPHNSGDQTILVQQLQMELKQLKEALAELERCASHRIRFQCLNFERH